jgi:hypothetical protein
MPRELAAVGLSPLEYWFFMALAAVGTCLHLYPGDVSFTRALMKAYVLVLLVSFATRSHLEFSDNQKAIRESQHAGRTA